jgi:hypothetical protein
LVWRGLSHKHSIGQTLPTWSMNKRQSRQIFGTWSVLSMFFIIHILGLLSIF